jgi:hypothetical protein
MQFRGHRRNNKATTSDTITNTSILTRRYGHVFNVIKKNQIIQKNKGTEDGLELKNIPQSNTK